MGTTRWRRSGRAIGKQKSDQWWLDAHTDQARVDAMLSTTLLKLTSATNGEPGLARRSSSITTKLPGMAQRGYQPGEVVPSKINLNNSEDGAKADNYTMPRRRWFWPCPSTRQSGDVRPQDIIVYDVRRLSRHTSSRRCWRRVQGRPFHPKFIAQGESAQESATVTYHGLETPDWVEGWSIPTENTRCKLIPTNFRRHLPRQSGAAQGAFLSLQQHGGCDSGQTAISCAEKNHLARSKGRGNCTRPSTPTRKASRTPIHPSLISRPRPTWARKTILFVLDGLYSGRKWRTYPVQFSNPPFNNRVEP